MYLFDEPISSGKTGEEEDEEAEEEVEVQKQKLLKVDMHFGKRKSLAALRTTCSHVEVSSFSFAGLVHLSHGSATHGELQQLYQVSLQHAVLR